MANSESRERSWRSGPIGLLKVLVGLLLIHLALCLVWLVPIYARLGQAGAYQAYLQYGNPYNAAYEQGVDALARWLVPPAREGEAIDPSLRFERPWNQAAALLVLFASIALIAWLYRREGSAPGWYRALLATLRVALVLLTMFMLSEAVLSVDRTGLPTFVVMIDDSSSTAIADQYEDPVTAQRAEALAGKSEPRGEPSRLAIARGWLENDDALFLRELRKNQQIRLDLVSTRARNLAEIRKPEDVETALGKLREAEPIGEQTRLGDGVRDVLTELRGAPPTAILLLTDGQNTDGEPLAKAAEFARSKGVPIYTVGLGDPSPTRDLELTDLMVDDVVFVDDLVRFEARLSGHGFEGESVDVRLVRRPADGPENAPGEEVSRVSVTVPEAGRFEPVEIRHRPEGTGEFVYSLELEPRPKELQVENNRLTRRVSVRDQKLKVLLVDGLPRYEYRYLLAFLKRDTTIELRTVLQSADTEYSEQEATALPTFPSETEGEDGLFSFDVVIFGDVDASLLSARQMENLGDFVRRRGGGVMFVAGQYYNPLSYRGTPLEPLLPLRLAEARDPASGGPGVESFVPVLTAEGRGHPIFRFAEDDAVSAQVWNSFQPMNWFLEIPRKQELAFVLATHPTLNGSDGPLPIILYQYVGAGKVLFQAVDETWRWRYRVADLYFGRYWIQAIRFLARSKLIGQKGVEINTDRRRYRRDQPVRISVRFINPGLAPGTDTLRVQVERAGRGPRVLELTRSPSTSTLYEGILPQAGEGEYEVRLLPPPLIESGMPTTSFRVDPPAGEYAEVRMNEAELIRAATLSRGQFYTPLVTASSLLKDLPTPKMVPLDTDPPIPLWNNPFLLAVFLGLLLAEWVLRKRKQMV